MAEPTIPSLRNAYNAIIAEANEKIKKLNESANIFDISWMGELIGGKTQEPQYGDSLEPDYDTDDDCYDSSSGDSW